MESVSDNTRREASGGAGDYMASVVEPQDSGWSEGETECSKVTSGSTSSSKSRTTGRIGTEVMNSAIHVLNDDIAGAPNRPQRPSRKRRSREGGLDRHSCSSKVQPSDLDALRVPATAEKIDNYVVRTSGRTPLVSHIWDMYEAPSTSEPMTIPAVQNTSVQRCLATHSNDNMQQLTAKLQYTEEQNISLCKQMRETKALMYTLKQLIREKTAELRHI